MSFVHELLTLFPVSENPAEKKAQEIRLQDELGELYEKVRSSLMTKGG